MNRQLEIDSDRKVYMQVTAIDQIKIGQNQDGSWYVYDLLNRVLVKDKFRTEKQAYDYARWEYITKPCFNGLVYKQLTREQFIAQWMEYSSVLLPLFLRANSNGYLDMQMVVEDGTGREWDAI
jgi:hypothetical protein